MANEKDPTAPATTPDPAQTEAQQPKYMTPDDFNGAMTARERRFEQRIAKMLDERFAAVAPVKGEPVSEDKASIAPGQQPTPDSLEIKRATAQIEALRRQMAAKDEAAAKEKAEMMARQEKADAIAALTEAGSINARGAYALLKDDGRIKRNASGELVMAVQKEYGEDEVPLAAGLREWLSTAEGKHYLPPRGGGEGSGTVVRGGARGGAAMTKEEAKREAQNMLTGFILGHK